MHVPSRTPAPDKRELPSAVRGLMGIALQGHGGDVAFCGWASNWPTRWVRNWTFRVTHPNLMVCRVTESRLQGGTRR
jgi:hypothetical protein